MALDDGSLYNLPKRDQIAPGTDQVGTVQAISFEHGEFVRDYQQRAGTTTQLATGGGLIYGGGGSARGRCHTP